MARIPGLVFDTQAAIERLVESGMPETQATTVMGIQADLIENKLATRADIDTAITAAKFDLIRWIVGVNVAAVVAVAGLFVTAIGLDRLFREPPFQADCDRTIPGLSGFSVDIEGCRHRIEP